MRGDSAVKKAESVQLEVWQMIGQAFEARRANGLNHSELARRLGVPRGQVCLWLRDRERMTLKAAARMADAMGYELEVRLTLSTPHRDVRGKTQ